MKRLLAFIIDDPRNFILPLSFILGAAALVAAISHVWTLQVKPSTERLTQVERFV